MNKIKKVLLNLWYGLPFGLKAADTEIMGSKNIDNNGVSINQEVSDERVAKHLLKGEVTQEVEELRYRTYKVDNEAKNYKYLGNGVAIKNEDNEYENPSRYKFTQDNSQICESVLDTMKQVGKYGNDRFRVEIDYSSFVRFKIERYITSIDVDINDETGLIRTTLHFNAQPNPYDAVSMPFINELKKISMGDNDKYFIEHNEILNSILNLSFTTYKAIGEEDFVNYCFINGAKYKYSNYNTNDITIVFEWGEYLRLPLNLESKYYSKSMAEKYKNKEKKNVAPNMGNTERKRYCSICGKEMSVYDADIQEYDGNQIICKECMAKALNN